jgi:hypothetical protein
MDEACNVRLALLEASQVTQDKKLESLDSMLEVERQKLDKITKLLSQIRWAITGALGAYIFSTTGLDDVLKALFKLLIGA